MIAEGAEPLMLDEHLGVRVLQPADVLVRAVRRPRALHFGRAQQALHL